MSEPIQPAKTRVKPLLRWPGWKQADMLQLRTRLDRLKGKWVLTINDSSDNRQLFKDCKVNPVLTTNRRLNTRTHAGKKFGELVITPA